MTDPVGEVNISMSKIFTIWLGEINSLVKKCIENNILIFGDKFLFIAKENPFQCNFKSIDSSIS
jgi:hypothetical protein